MSDLPDRPRAGAPGADPWSRAPALWTGVNRLVAAWLGDVAALSDHGLGPLAADLLASRGEPVPPSLVDLQHRAQVSGLMAPSVLARVREACEGPVVVLKGAEVAARYPGGARGFGDIDLLVPDARAVQRSLLAAGFEELPDHDGRWVGIQHLNPLVAPGSSLVVEVHSVPKWPDGVRAPRPDDIFERAVPTELGVPGIGAPCASDHALLLAAHAWAHQPLGKLRDLVDVGALTAEADRAELERRARAWGLLPIWRTMTGALEALLDGRRTWPLRLWATHLAEVRTQTVLESHLQRLVSPFWGAAPGAAARLSARALRHELTPAFGERWAEKLRRTAAALRRPTMSVHDHRELLGDAASRRRTPPRQAGAPDARVGDDASDGK